MTPRVLFERIQADDPAAAEEFYRQMRVFVRSIAIRVGFTDAEDVLHDTYLAVVDAIKQNRILDPDKLWGFTRETAYKIIRHRSRSYERRMVIPIDGDRSRSREESPE